MSGHFVDDRHALYVGWVLMHALMHGLAAQAVTDDAGNYTDRISIDLNPEVGAAPVITLVVPPPPADWSLS